MICLVIRSGLGWPMWGPLSVSGFKEVGAGHPAGVIIMVDTAVHFQNRTSDIRFLTRKLEGGKTRLFTSLCVIFSMTKDRRKLPLWSKLVLLEDYGWHSEGRDKKPCRRAILTTAILRSHGPASRCLHNVSKHLRFYSTWQVLCKYGIMIKWIIYNAENGKLEKALNNFHLAKRKNWRLRG